MDADNTLFDFTGVEKMAIESVFHRLSIAWDDRYMDIYSPYNQSLWAAFERGEIEKSHLLSHRFTWLGEQIGHHINGRLFSEKYEEYLCAHHRLIPGSEELCRKLYDKFTLALMTNGNSKMQRARLESSVLNPYFKYVFISEELGCAKPSKAFFDTAFDEMGVLDRSAVLMVGDTVAADMVGANNAGIDCCWYNPDSRTQCDATITYEISDLSQLTKIIL